MPLAFIDYTATSPAPAMPQQPITLTKYAPRKGKADADAAMQGVAECSRTAMRTHRYATARESGDFGIIALQKSISVGIVCRDKYGQKR